MLHQGREPDEVLVGRALMLGRGSQRAAEFMAVPDREYGVGIAAIDAQKHRTLPQK